MFLKFTKEDDENEFFLYYILNAKFKTEINFLNYYHPLISRFNSVFMGQSDYIYFLALMSSNLNSNLVFDFVNNSTTTSKLNYLMKTPTTINLFN